MIYYYYKAIDTFVVALVVKNSVPARTVGKIRGALCFETKQNIRAVKGGMKLKRRKAIIGIYDKLSDIIETRFKSAAGKVVRLNSGKRKVHRPGGLTVATLILLHRRKPWKLDQWDKNGGSERRHDLFLPL